MVQKIVLPCDLNSWTSTQQLIVDLNSVEDSSTLVQLLSDIYNSVKDISRQRESIKENPFLGLKTFLDEVASEEEKNHFYNKTLPCIVDHALALETRKPTNGIEISLQQQASSLALKRDFIASVIANAFLCTFPKRPRRPHFKLQDINFIRFFLHLPQPSQCSKLRCVLNYFDRIAGGAPKGNVIYSRKVMVDARLPKLDTWLKSNKPLCQVLVLKSGGIEDVGSDVLQVDFANRYIGGGVLGTGCLQEEIRFVVSPELLVALMFMECMDRNEAIHIQGFEQFSQYTGYASSFEYQGDFHDTTQRDSKGNLDSMICAIDAVPFGKTHHRQYQEVNILRELNKAYIGFYQSSKTLMRSKKVSLPSTSDSTEEEFFTALESLDEEELKLVESTIFDFVGSLTKAVLTLAIKEASKKDDKYVKKSFVRPEIDISFADNDMSEADEASLDHTESDDHFSHNSFEQEQQWLNQFRRRSSNLSSDATSRRSSNSTRLSSDFSSEFEDIYEGFEQLNETKSSKRQDMVGIPGINEFASNLVTQIIKEGALIAILSTPGLPNFDVKKPFNVTVKPSPIHPSTRDLNQTFLGATPIEGPTPRQLKSVLAASRNISTVSAQKTADKLLEAVFNCESNEETPKYRSNITQNSNNDESTEKSKEETMSQYALHVSKDIVKKSILNLASNGKHVKTSSTKDESMNDSDARIEIAQNLVRDVIGQSILQLEKDLNFSLSKSFSHVERKKHFSNKKSKEPYLKKLENFADNLIKDILHDATQEQFCVMKSMTSQKRIQIFAEDVDSELLPKTLSLESKDLDFPQELNHLDASKRARSKSYCGFQDLTLSSFAQQLVRSNPCTPTFECPSFPSSKSSSEKSGNTKNSFDKLSWKSSSEASPKGSTESPLHFRRGSYPSRNSSRKGSLETISDGEMSDFSRVLLVRGYVDQIINQALGKSYCSLFGKEWYSPEDEAEKPKIQNLLYEKFSEQLSTKIITEAVKTSVSFCVTKACRKSRTRPRKRSRISKPDDYQQSSTLSISQDLNSDSDSSIHLYEDATDIPYKIAEKVASGLTTRVFSETMQNLKQNRETRKRTHYGRLVKDTKIAQGKGIQELSERLSCNSTRPVATGNWGCGAFGGNPQLKALLQWMAASYADVPLMAYCTFGNEKIMQLQEVCTIIQNRKWTIGDLGNFILSFSQRSLEEFQEKGVTNLDLFQELLSSGT